MSELPELRYNLEHHSITANSLPELTDEQGYEVVHRCNCHDDLVAACRMGLAGLDALFELAERLGNEKPANILSIEFVKAALDKVKVEKIKP